jgi:hypothetical protein
MWFCGVAESGVKRVQYLTTSFCVFLYKETKFTSYNTLIQ